MENLGISNANIDRTEYSKSEELILELKGKAVAKTKKIAEKLAKPLGQKVGKAIYISDTHHEYYRDSEEVLLMAYPEPVKAPKVDTPLSPINIEIKNKARSQCFRKIYFGLSILPVSAVDKHQ